MPQKARIRMDDSKTLVFVPFKYEESKGDRGFADLQWKDNNKQISSRYKDSDLARSEFSEIGIRNRQDDVIYIRGHCTAGSTNLVNGDETKSIEAKKLAALVHEYMDNPNWKGSFKIYACESGKGKSMSSALAETFSSFGMTSYNTQPFVQLFADELYNEFKYKACSFYGYTETCTLEFVNSKAAIDSIGYVHKWSTVHSDPKTHELTRRASECRVKIAPKKR